MGRIKSYKCHLMQRLTNPKEAAGYLNAVLIEENLQVVRLAMKDVI